MGHPLFFLLRKIGYTVDKHFLIGMIIPIYGGGMTRLSPDIDDYLQQGIYGKKEINPDERRKFLGTLRERVVIALKQSQVREDGTYQEVDVALRENKMAHLFLNGNMDYEYISKYKKLADKYGVDFTIVTNKEYNSELGLVLAFDYAIDKENIYVEKEKIDLQQASTKKKGFFAKLFSK